MSGSGGNAFLDFLRMLAPAGIPAWPLMLAAALISAAVAIALIRVNRIACVRLERRVGAPSEPRMVHPLTLAAALAALAAYPFAPHIFFTDIEIGLLVILVFASLVPIVEVFGGETGSTGAAHEVADLLARQLLLALALLVPVLAGGTLNLIEASRLQSDWFGMGWFVFKSPFGLPALFVFFLAAVGVSRRGNHAGMFLVAAIGAVFFLGGFESPLTWVMRQSLGEDPGFLNHVTLADGTTQQRIAIGGLVFQLVCAATLIAKTWLGVFVILRARAMPQGSRVERWMKLSHVGLTSFALACVLGAGLWEWARAEWWS